MAKRTKKAEVKKFGGTESLGTVREESDQKFHSYLSDKDFEQKEVNWDAHSIESQSETNLEQDKGDGHAVIIRHYEFKIQPDVLAQCLLVTGHYPDKQMLFNSVVKFIESSLWRDGMQVFPNTEPRILVNDFFTKFEVFVGAIPAKGQRLLEQPKTLTELING